MKDIQGDQPLLKTTLTMDAHGNPIVSAFGEVDISSVDVLSSTLLGAIFKADKGYLIVDLRGVEFMDSKGVRALLVAQQNLEMLPEGGERLLVVCGEGIRALILTLDLEEQLLLCLDLQEAHNYSRELCPV